MYKPPTALVIDDSPELRLVISSMFRSLGATVLAARDGETGLAMARQHRPDIVCLDLMLPTIGGIEICRTLKADPEVAGIPVLVVSARRLPQDRANARSAGADAYLTKPLNRDEFLATVRSLLWQRQMAVGA